MSKLRSAAGYYHTNDPHYTVQLQPVLHIQHPFINPATALCHNPTHLCSTRHSLATGDPSLKIL